MPLAPKGLSDAVRESLVILLPPSPVPFFFHHKSLASSRQCGIFARSVLGRGGSMIRRSTKWDHIGTSIFSVMTQKANAAQAINLAQGFPDFDGPTEIKEAAIAAIRNGHNQYAPAFE